MDVILATAGWDSLIRFWDAHTKVTYRTIAHAESHVNSLEISTDKKHIVAAGNPKVSVYDIEASTNAPLVQFEGHVGNVVGLQLHKNGKFIVSAGEDGTMKVWDMRVANAVLEYTHRRHAASMNCIALHPNHMEVIAGDDSGSIRVWDLNANKCSRELVPEEKVPVRSVSVATDGSRLAAAGNTGNVYVWSLQKDPSVMEATSHGDGTGGSGPSRTPSFQPMNFQGAADTATVVSKYTCHITPQRMLSAHKDHCLKAVLSPNVRLLATTSADKTIKVWDVREDFAQVAVLSGHRNWVWDVSFSADSAFLISASTDHEARLWDLQSGSDIRRYTGHVKGITSVALNDKNF